MLLNAHTDCKLSILGDFAVIAALYAKAQIYVGAWSWGNCERPQGNHTVGLRH